MSPVFQKRRVPQHWKSSSAAIMQAGGSLVAAACVRGRGRTPTSKPEALPRLLLVLLKFLSNFLRDLLLAEADSVFDPSRVHHGPQELIPAGLIGVLCPPATHSSRNERQVHIKQRQLCIIYASFSSRDMLPRKQSLQQRMTQQSSLQEAKLGASTQATSVLTMLCSL